MSGEVVMKQRIISAVIGLSVLAVALYRFDTVYFNIAAGVVFLIASYEVYNAFREGNSKIGMAAVALFGVVILNQQYIGYINGKLFVIFFMTCYAMCCVFGFHKINVKAFSASVLYAVYVLLGFYAILDIKADMPYAFFGYDAVYLFILCCIIAWCCDIFAYFSGYFFGKHKMSPTLSPKKTVEGAVGGVIGAVLCACLSLYLYSILKPVLEGTGLSYGVAASSYIKMAVVAVFGALLGMVGDLFASAVKRQTGIKDYGNIMPGHGGVIDRFDSVLLLAPYIWRLSDFVAARGGIFHV